MGGDTGLLNPGDRVGGNMADDEASVLLCCCQLSCIPQLGLLYRNAPQRLLT
jgi:hypothetical protein